MGRRNRKQRLRTGVQIGFFVLVALVVTAHSVGELGVSIPFIAGASLHAICPFGGVVTLYELITEGSFIQKIHEAALVLAVAVVALSVVFGPVFCGWICPFGTFQRWMASLGKRLLGRRYGKIIPRRLDHALRYVRYAVLAAVVIATAVSAKLVFSDYDPYFALFNFWTGEVALTAFIFLGFFMLLSLIVERPFCRYACPYGALLGLSNRFRIFKIRRVASTCIDCKACDRACPMGINISEAGAVKDTQCISCLLCTSEQVCPVADTVVVTPAEGRKGLSGKTVGLLTLILFFSAIGTSFAFGWWQTVSSRVPRLIAEGELAGEYDPSDIRGSYTFADIEKHFGVSSQFLAQAFAMQTDNPSGIAAKDIEPTFGELPDGNELELGTDSVRYMVSLFLGFPHTPEESTGLPNPGLEMLLEQGRIDFSLYEQLVRERGVSLVGTQAVVTEAEQTQSLEIKGITTFNDLISNGVSREDIEEVLGFPMPSGTQTIKESSEEAGIEFSVLKQRILEHLASP